jgi:hypothetical protein
MGVPTLMALDNKQMDTIGAFVKNKQYADWDVAKAEMYLQQVQAALPKAGSTAKGKLERYKNSLESGVIAARQAHITDAKKEIVELKKIVPAIPAADIKAIENVVNNAKPNQNEDAFLKSIRENELFKAREATLNIEKATPKAKVGAIQQTLRIPPPVAPGTPVVVTPGLPLPPLPVKPGTPAVVTPGLPLPSVPGTTQPVLPPLGTQLPPAIVAPVVPPAPPMPGRAIVAPVVAPTMPTLPPLGTQLPPAIVAPAIPTPPPFPGTKPAAKPTKSEDSLLQEIQAGKQLKSVESTDKPAVTSNLPTSADIVGQKGKLKSSGEKEKTLEDQWTALKDELENLEKPSNKTPNKETRIKELNDKLIPEARIAYLNDELAKKDLSLKSRTNFELELKALKKQLGQSTSRPSTPPIQKELTQKEKFANLQNLESELKPLKKESSPTAGDKKRIAELEALIIAARKDFTSADSSAYEIYKRRASIAGDEDEDTREGSGASDQDWE